MMLRMQNGRYAELFEEKLRMFGTPIGVKIPMQQRPEHAYRLYHSNNPGLVSMYEELDEYNALFYLKYESGRTFQSTFFDTPAVLDMSPFDIPTKREDRIPWVRKFILKAEVQNAAIDLLMRIDGVTLQSAIATVRVNSNEQTLCIADWVGDINITIPLNEERYNDKALMQLIEGAVQLDEGQLLWYSDRDYKEDWPKCRPWEYEDDTDPFITTDGLLAFGTTLIIQYPETYDIEIVHKVEVNAHGPSLRGLLEPTLHWNKYNFRLGGNDEELGDVPAHTLVEHAQEGRCRWVATPAHLYNIQIEVLPEKGKPPLEHEVEVNEYGLSLRGLLKPTSYWNQYNFKLAGDNEELVDVTAHTLVEHAREGRSRWVATPCDPNEWPSWEGAFIDLSA